MDFLGCEFSDVLGIQVHSGSDNRHLNPGTLEAEQQAAKWFRRVARNSCTGYRLRCYPCSFCGSCIALGSIVLLAVGLVAQYVINLVDHV